MDQTSNKILRWNYKFDNEKINGDSYSQYFFFTITYFRSANDARNFNPFAKTLKIMIRRYTYIIKNGRWQSSNITASLTSPLSTKYLQ